LRFSSRKFVACAVLCRDFQVTDSQRRIEPNDMSRGEPGDGGWSVRLIGSMHRKRVAILALAGAAVALALACVGLRACPAGVIDQSVAGVRSMPVAARDGRIANDDSGSSQLSPVSAHAISQSFANAVRRHLQALTPDALLVTLDQTVQSYLADARASRNDKLVTLQALSAEAKHPMLRRYLIETLTALHPLELSAALIDRFRVSHHADEQVLLVRALASAFAYPHGRPVSPETAEQLNAIKRFMQRAFVETTDPVVYRELLLHLHAVMPSEQAMALLPVSAGFARVADADLASFYLQALIATDAQQVRLLPELVERFRSGKLTGTPDFVAQLLGHFDADRDHRVFGETFFRAALPLVLLGEPAIGSEAGYENTSNYERWARYRAAMESDDLWAGGTAATRARLAEIAATAPAVNAASIVLHSPYNDRPDTRTRAMLITKLDVALGDPSTTGSHREFLAQALAHLQAAAARQGGR